MVELKLKKRLYSIFQFAFIGLIISSVLALFFVPEKMYVSQIHVALSRSIDIAQGHSTALINVDDLIKNYNAQISDILNLKNAETILFGKSTDGVGIIIEAISNSTTRSYKLAQKAADLVVKYDKDSLFNIDQKLVTDHNLGNFEYTYSNVSPYWCDATFTTTFSQSTQFLIKSKESYKTTNYIRYYIFNLLFCFILGFILDPVDLPFSKRIKVEK